MPGIAIDEMQHPMMGAAEAQFEQHLVRIADEIAIGKKQQLDDVPDRVRGRYRRRTGRCAIGHTRAGRGDIIHIYVSHVDIFWFYVTKTTR